MILHQFVCRWWSTDLMVLLAYPKYYSLSFWRTFLWRNLWCDVPQCWWLPPADQNHYELSSFLLEGWGFQVGLIDWWCLGWWHLVEWPARLFAFSTWWCSCSLCPQELVWASHTDRLMWPFWREQPFGPFALSFCPWTWWLVAQQWHQGAWPTWWGWPFDGQTSPPPMCSSLGGLYYFCWWRDIATTAEHSLIHWSG